MVLTEAANALGVLVRVWDHLAASATLLEDQRAKHTLVWMGLTQEQSLFFFI